jgi:hypothetical protein
MSEVVYFNEAAREVNEAARKANEVAAALAAALAANEAVRAADGSKLYESFMCLVITPDGEWTEVKAFIGEDVEIRIDIAGLSIYIQEEDVMKFFGLRKA